MNEQPTDERANENDLLEQGKVCLWEVVVASFFIAEKRNWSLSSLPSARATYIFANLHVGPVSFNYFFAASRAEVN